MGGACLSPQTKRLCGSAMGFLMPTVIVGKGSMAVCCAEAPRNCCVWHNPRSRAWEQGAAVRAGQVGPS